MKGTSHESFEYGKLADRTWPSDILNYIAKIHECKGREEMFVRQRPIELDRLVEIAKIQSTEASNKIEGIIATGSRMKQLFEEKTTPRNRDEDEIMGYRDPATFIRSILGDQLIMTPCSMRKHYVICQVVKKLSSQ